MESDPNQQETPPKLDIDLNVPINDVDVATEFDLNGNGIDVDHPIRDREVIDISSDDDDEEMVDNDGTPGLDLQLGINQTDGACGSSERRYTREDKGKATVDDFSSLSLVSGTAKQDLNLNFKSDKTHDDKGIDVKANNAIPKLPTIPILVRQLLESQETEEQRQKRKERIRNARPITVLNARYDYWSEVKNRLTAQMKWENLSDSCSIELKGIIDQNKNPSAQQLIRWSPRPTFHYRHVPSLLDLCLNVLANHGDAISTLENLPDWLRSRLANVLCDIHKMDIHIVELLFKGSPTEVRIKNGSWMTEQQLVDVLRRSDLQNLRVLQLDLCGQCSFDTIIRNYLSPSQNSLPCLGILSLKGAASLSDSTLRQLLYSAPLLQSVNLSQCTLLTCDGIKILAAYLQRSLKELYIDECPGIDARKCFKSIMLFEQLEVLSVDGIQHVDDTLVTLVTSACGRNLKELNLANCERLTDRCLHAIGRFCPGLCLLNISNVKNLTDLGLCCLADGCKSLESLNLTRAGFSDAVVAAFLETSGRSLKELSLNHVHKVGFNTALSLSKFGRNLVSLDLSWCRQLREEALGVITDNCTSLRLLKIFGCSQITDRFIDGHGNPDLHIVGRGPMSLLEKIRVLEPVEILLRRSALKTSRLYFPSPSISRQ